MFAGMGLWQTIREVYFGTKPKEEPGPAKRPTVTRVPFDPVKHTARTPRSGGPRITRAVRNFNESEVVDLRGLDAIDLRVVGTMYLVKDQERESLSSDEYVLVLEPENKHDADAVAVYSGDRKVGYLSAKKAASYAPVLRGMSAHAFRVGGTRREGKSALVLLLPKLPPLRAFAAAR